MASMVPDDLKAELETVRLDVIAGKMPTNPADLPEEAKKPSIGTADKPIKVLFVPSVDANVITTGGEIMAAALKEATGLEFKVSIPTSYAATIEEICASPTDTMAFIPAQGYVIANQLCGVDVSFKAIRRGWGVYWTMFIVPRDLPIKELEGIGWQEMGVPGCWLNLWLFIPAGHLPGPGYQTR